MLEVVRVQAPVIERLVGQDVVGELDYLELIAESLDFTADGLEDFGVRGYGSADGYGRVPLPAAAGEQPEAEYRAERKSGYLFQVFVSFLLCFCGFSD